MSLFTGGMFAQDERGKKRWVDGRTDGRMDSPSSWTVAAAGHTLGRPLGEKKYMERSSILVPVIVVQSDPRLSG